MILSRNGGGCPLCNCSMDHFAGSPVHEQGRGNAGCCHAMRCKGIIPRSWALFLNTANLPQMALVTQLSLPLEICRRGTRGSKIQADIYSTLFIPSQPFLDARSFTEHWRLCSQSAGLWVRALLQQKLKWQASNPSLCCLKRKYLKQNHLPLLHLSTPGHLW